MFRPTELFIGLRYTRAKRSNHFISFISLISMLGITLGVTALITVLSVMNGAVREVREVILAMSTHATISSYQGTLQNWPTVLKDAEKNPHVVAGTPYISGQGMLMNDTLVRGAILQGILPASESRVSEIADKMAVGTLNDLKPGDYSIILGQTLAAMMGLQVGDKVTVVAPQSVVTPAGIMPRLKRFTLVGIFDAGMHQYDSGLALIHIVDAGKLFRMGDGVSGIRLKLDNIFNAPQISRAVARSLPPGQYLVRDWTQEHANFFRAVQTEKLAMLIILSLIVAVAAFNVVSTLVMVVTDKQADIAILRTIGMTPMGIMAVFVVQGLTIGIIGTVLGVLGGVSLALNLDVVVPFIENLFNVQLMPADVYMISGVPSQLEWSDVSTVIIVAFTLATLATLYPAWKAARTQPAEALRYE